MSSIIFYETAPSIEMFEHLTLGYPEDAMKPFTTYMARSLSDIIAWVIGSNQDRQLYAFRVFSREHVEQIKYVHPPVFVLEEDQAVIQRLNEWSMCHHRLTHLIECATVLHDSLSSHRYWMNCDISTGSQFHRLGTTARTLQKLVADESNFKNEVRDLIRTVQHWPEIP